MERQNCSKQTLYHLKRIGPAPNRPRVVNVMDFFKVTSLIGRNALQVDFYIDSNERMQSHMISRCHARVVRQQNNDHKLFDDSLNGIFVNHIKIRGCVILCEGDRVTFGHPGGRDIPFGTWERQVNNHHQFIFEKCCCEPKSTVKKSPKRGKFVIPKKTSPKNLAAKRERNQTRTFTQADIQDLKEKSEALFPTCSKEDSLSTAGINNSETSETTAPVDKVEVSSSTTNDQLSEGPDASISDTPKAKEDVEILDTARATSVEFSEILIIRTDVEISENQIATPVVDISENVRTTADGDISNIPRSDADITDILKTDTEISNIPRSGADISDIPGSNADISDTPKSVDDISDIPRSDAEISGTPRSEADISDIHRTDADIMDTPRTDADISDTLRPDADIMDIHRTDTDRTDADISDTLRPDADIMDIHRTDTDISDIPRTVDDTLDNPRTIVDISNIHRTDTDISDIPRTEADILGSPRTVDDILDTPITTTVDEISEAPDYTGDVEVSDNLRSTSDNEILDIPRITASEEISDISRPTTDDVIPDNLRTTIHENVKSTSAVDTFLNVLNDASITDVQVQQNKRLGDERESLVVSQSNPLCDSANIDMSELTTENTSGLLEQGVHVDEQVVTDHEELARNFDRSPLCPTHPIGNNTADDDDYQKDFEFKRPEVVDNPDKITSVSLAEEEESHLEESRYILSDSIDYTFSEQEMEEENESFESDSDNVDPRESNKRETCSTLTVKERTSTECEDKKDSFQSDSDKVDLRERKNGEISSNKTAEERTSVGCEGNVWDIDMVDLGESDDGEGRGGEVMNSTTSEGIEVQTSENLCSGELLICPNAAHIYRPDHGEITQTTQVSKGDTSLCTNKGKSHVLICESESKEKELVPGISPKKVIRSSFKLTDSLEYTVEESVAEVESGMEVNKESVQESKQKMEKTDVKDDVDKVDVDLKLEENEPMKEDEEIVENIHEKNQQIVEAIDVYDDEVLGKDLDLKNCGKKMEEFNTIGHVFKFKDTMEDLDQQDRLIGKAAHEALLDNVTVKPTSESVPNREAVEGEALKDEEPISDSQKNEPIPKCDAVEDKEQATGSDALEDNGVLKTTKPNNKALIDNATMMPTSDSVELVNQVPVQNTEAVEGEAFEDKKPTLGSETVEGEEPKSNREALEDMKPTSGSKTMQDEEPISICRTLEDEGPISNSEALEDKAPTLGNTTMQDEEPISKSGTLEDEGPISNSEALEVEGPISNSEALEVGKPILNCEAMEIGIPISNIDAIENIELAPESVALRDNVTPKIKEQILDSGALEAEESISSSILLKEEKPTSNDEVIEDEKQTTYTKALEIIEPTSNIEAFEENEQVCNDASEVEILILRNEDSEDEKSINSKASCEAESISINKGLEKEESESNSEEVQEENPASNGEEFERKNPISSSDAVKNETLVNEKPSSKRESLENNVSLPKSDALEGEMTLEDGEQISSSTELVEKDSFSNIEAQEQTIDKLNSGDHVFENGNVRSEMGVLKENESELDLIIEVEEFKPSNEQQALTYLNQNSHDEFESESRVNSEVNKDLEMSPVAQNNEVAGLKNKESDQTCTLEESDTHLTFSSSSSFTPSDLICTFYIDADDVTDIVGTSQNDKHRNRQTSLNAGSCDTSTADNVSSVADAIQTNSEENLTEELEINNINDFNGRNTSEQDTSRFEQRSIELIKMDYDTKSQGEDPLQDSAPVSDGVNDCKLADQDDGPNHMESSTTLSYSNEMENCHAVEIKVQATTLPLEYLNGKKRKIEEMASAEDCDPPKKKKLSEKELEPVKKIVSNFFKIREYCEKHKDVDKNDLRKHLLGNLVRHFFKKHPTKGLVEEIKCSSKSVVTKIDLQETSHNRNPVVCDGDSNNNSQNTQSDTEILTDTVDGSRFSYEASEKGESQEDIMEVLSLSQESSSSLTSSQPDSIPIYQASVKPGCGIVVNMGQWKKTEKIALEETSKDTAVCDVQTQANSLDIDVETTVLGSQDHLMDDRPLEEGCEDSDQTCLDEESANLEDLDNESVNSKVRERSSSNESDTSQRSELLLEKVSFPVIDMDDEESCSTIQERKSFSSEENQEGEDKQPVEDVMNQENGNIGSPHSLHSTTSIDYTEEYIGIVDSFNDIQHSCTDKQSDSDSTLLQSGQDSALEDTDDQNQKDLSEDMTESNTDTSINPRESSENVGSQSSELDSEGVEILSTKSTSESELEILYGPSFITSCCVKGSLKAEDEIKSEFPRKKESLILKEEKVGAKSGNGPSDLKTSFDQSSLSETEKSDPETAVGCSPGEDKDLTDDASTTLVNTPSDTNNERSNTKKYFKSRLPKFESDSDIEIVDTKPSLPLKSADDFHISLSDSSSDDLPEVLFLREEKATAAQSVLCNKALDIKEEPVTPSKTPDLSKAVSRLELTPSTQGDNSSPRKVCRKRLSLRRTPVKKQKESKPSPLARRTRTLRKSPDKRQKSKRMFIDSDIEIVSGSESEEDFTPSRIKKIKQEAETDSYSDSEARKDGRGDKIKEDLDEDSGNIPEQKDKQLEDDGNDRKQQQGKEPGDSAHLPDNQGGNRDNSPELEDKEEVNGPCEEESGIKRIYPLLEQSSVESTGAGSLSDIFQMEDSEHTQPGESRENQEERHEQDVFPGEENSKPAEDSTGQGEQLLYKVNTMPNQVKDSERSEGDWKDSGQGEIDSNEKGDKDMPPETTKDESEPLEDDQCADDFVANTCPENSEDEDTYGFPPVLSTYCSQALSPLVPVTSENAEPKINPDMTNKTDSPNKNLQTPTKPILQMEFDSDSDFSALEVNFDALDSPEINVSGADGYVETGNLDEGSYEVFDAESSGNEMNQNKEKAKEDEGREDREMEEDLPDISRKRKSQDDSVDFESKRQKTSTGKDNSSQIKDLQTETRSSDQHSSQNASVAKESSSISRVRQLMQKLRAKKSTGCVTDQSPDQSSSSGMASNKETPGDAPRTSHIQRRLLPSFNTPYQRTLDYLQRCKEILQTLKTDFSQAESLAGNPRIIQWKKEMNELETRMSLSKTVIAVVGDTGSGKSSLMNALLDQLDILPTSGMRACTAVVVEVVNNTTNNKYEADITFLSREEWYTELKLLLRDLTDVHGNIKKGTPDPKSEAGVAFLKIKAVYGKVDRFQALCRQTNVTKWLDKVKTISHSEPTHFRNAIDKYIETADPGVGNQYWPIVKKVTVRLPNCDACSSGAVLVDLPGVRDSNAARDKIARDHLKNCTAVWVVSSIHRAIDDKTAKDLLGENFRRQLLMDGQYGNIAFICTKTDVIKNSEIIRGLHMEEKVRPIEDEINRLEMEKNDLEISKRSNKKCIKQMEKESAELRQNIEEMEECLLTDEGCGESEEIKEMQVLLKEKQEALQKNIENLQTHRQAVDEDERKSLQHGMTIAQRRKELSSLCAKARNDYSRKEIKRDFKAGLREMKRKAGNVSNIEEFEDDDLYNSDEDDEDIGNSAENLKVFCVSATEYQKMRNIIVDDGPPTVFGTEEETQIPALRSYIHQMTEVRHRSSMERILQRVAQFVFDIQNYLTEDETVQTKGERLKSRSAIEERTFTLKQKLESVIAQLQADIEGALSNQIKPKLGEGITAATARANEQTAKWSSPVDKENKQAGGLHWCTYRATVRRQGVFSSPTYGQVNFNEDLTAPMYTSISIVWDKVFSGILWGYFERFKVTVQVVLRQFVANLCQELHTHGVQSSSTQRVQLYLLDTANQKLTETVAQLKEYVTERQRDASRVLTPVIQENLTPVYDYCAVQSGDGTYARIKQAMAEGVDKGRLYMFDDASRRLLQELEQIQTDVVAKVRDTCISICTTLKTAFEPLWEAPGTFLHLRDNLLPSITEISLKLQNIMEEAGVRVPVTAMTTASPAASSNSDQSAAQSCQVQRSQDIQGNDSSALPQHSSPDSAVLSSIKSELGGTRQPLAASAIKKEPQASSSSSPSMRFPDVKSEPTSNIKVCCFCGYPGTNPVQCERCLVTRQTSGGMVYRKCNFCRQIGTSTQVCEKCKRCPHCGNYVLPPNSVCQRCKTNAPSTSRDESNSNPLSAVLNLATSDTLKRLADAIHLPKRPAKACRSSKTVQQKESQKIYDRQSSTAIGQQRGSPQTSQQNRVLLIGQQGGSPQTSQENRVLLIGQQRGSPQTSQQNRVLLIGQQGGSTQTVQQNSSSLKGQQGRSVPTIQQVGSIPPLRSQPNFQQRNLGEQPQSQIIYDRRSSTPYSQASNLSSGGRDGKGTLQPPSRVPKNLGYKDMCKEN